MNDLERMDRHSHLHPFTSVSESRPSGRILTRASGMTVVDEKGRSYLDSLSGLWCVNAGYGNARITDAIAKTSRELSFGHNMMGAGNEYAVRLADRLLQLTDGVMRKVFFGNSGSDANDTNLKLARLYHRCRGEPDRIKFIARHGGYHGTTLATSSLSGLNGIRRSVGLPDPHYVHVSAPEIFTHVRPGRFVTEEQYADFLAQELEATILREGPDQIAAFVAEPVMAVGGILLPPRTYFSKIKAVLDKYGILLIIDDVVCAFGRLGHWYGWQTLDVRPDLVTLAKGLTSGYVPMSASLLGERLWRTLEQSAGDIGTFGHGFTTSGHPLAASAALANIDTLEQQQLLTRATAQGALLLETLLATLEDCAVVGDIRGQGLLVGVELVADLDTLRPFIEPGAFAAKVAAACLDLDLIVRALPDKDVIAFAPPLTITAQEIADIARRFAQAVKQVAKTITQ
ncbi:aspartate aminotransferase family protein [Pseudomonas sp. NPDC088368]|uniref:aminotransferase family protein n=1 Tax=Pseudomonas sp. NPDC088368 TaxID=3364453 RepID=UPI0038072BB2